MKIICRYRVWREHSLCGGTRARTHGIRLNGHVHTFCSLISSSKLNCMFAIIEEDSPIAKIQSAINQQQQNYKSFCVAVFFFPFYYQNKHEYFLN